MSLDLLELEQLGGKYKPSPIETLQYLFLERGISLLEFNELPIPYIINMVKAINYFEEQKAKAMKKK